MACGKSWRCTMRIWLAVGLLVSALIVGVWDIYATARGEPGNTVSATLYDWAVQFPVLPFALGVITGHLLWPHIPTVPAGLPISPASPP